MCSRPNPPFPGGGLIDGTNTGAWRVVSRLVDRCHDQCFLFFAYCQFHFQKCFEFFQKKIKLRTNKTFLRLGVKKHLARRHETTRGTLRLEECDGDRGAAAWSSVCSRNREKTNSFRILDAHLLSLVWAGREVESCSCKSQCMTAAAVWRACCPIASPGMFWKQCCHNLLTLDGDRHAPRPAHANYFNFGNMTMYRSHDYLGSCQ